MTHPCGCSISFLKKLSDSLYYKYNRKLRIEHSELCAWQDRVRQPGTILANVYNGKEERNFMNAWKSLTTLVANCASFTLQTLKDTNVKTVGTFLRNLAIENESSMKNISHKLQWKNLVKWTFHVINVVLFTF